MKNKAKKAISSYIDQNMDWLIDNVLEVAAKDTINTPPVGNENNGQEVIEKIFKDLRLQIDRFSPHDVEGFKEKPYYLKGRTYHNRDNIVGSTGEGNKFTLIFNGHMDTVPSDKFNWQKTKPFNPQVMEDKIYGLGVCDMKSGIICSIFALKAILDLGFRIRGKVIIESVVDEEFGGANGSLACVSKGYTGDLAVISEPTSMRLCVSNVCSKTLLLSAYGGGGLNYFGDSATDINPIILMSEVLLMIKKYEGYLNSIKHKYPLYNEMKTPFNFLFSDIEAGKIGPDKIMTTPDRCLVRIYIMNYPDIENDKFDSMLVSFLKQNTLIEEALEKELLKIEDYSRFIEGGEMNLGIEKNKAIVQSIQDNAKIFTNRKLELGAALGGTDFFAFSNYGNTPCIVLGPGGGNLHSADEYVEVRDIVDLSKIFAGLIYDTCC